MAGIKASELSLKIYNAMLELEKAQAELSMFQFHEASETLVIVKRDYHSNISRLMLNWLSKSTHWCRRGMLLIVGAGKCFTVGNSDPCERV